MLANQRRFLFLAAGIVLALGGCSDLGNPIRPQPRPELSTTSLDFGTVAVNAAATRNLLVRNSGSASLAGAASISCAGYELLSGGGAFVIAPGETRTIVVRFTPSAVGSFPCTLDLGPNSPAVSISGSGAVQAPGAQCAVLPDSIDFGSSAVGHTKLGAIQIFSVGTAPLLVNVVSTGGDFGIVSGAGPAEIPAGGFLNVVVEFHPQAGRRRRATIAVGPGCPDVIVKGLGTTVSLSNDIHPILLARCTESCHYHYFNDPTNGYHYLSIYTGYWITPFDTTNSYLYSRITNTGVYEGAPMPPTDTRIPQEERDKFRDWILEGAADN